jgi:adenosine deaminase
MLASDLHVHLDGSLRADTVRELGAAAGLWSEADGSARVSALRFRPGMSLTSCLARFETTIGLLQTAPALSRAARELVQDSYLDGVRHTEFRLCPPLHTRRGLTEEEVMEAVLAGADEGVSDCSREAPGELVSARAVLSVLEGMDQDAADRIVRLAIRFADAGVAGVDLAGDESLFDPGPLARPFGDARDAGLGITVHAGEGHDASHVTSAVEVLRAARIGHGVSAGSDRRVTALLAERGVTVEVCLTSNVHTGAVARLEDHPLPRLLRAGVRVTLATDNRFFSGTTLSREYDLAAERLLVGREDIAPMVMESAASSFLPPSTREALGELYERGLRRGGERSSKGEAPGEKEGSRRAGDTGGQA